MDFISNGFFVAVLKVVYRLLHCSLAYIISSFTWTMQENSNHRITVHRILTHNSHKLFIALFEDNYLYVCLIFWQSPCESMGSILFRKYFPTKCRNYWYTTLYSPSFEQHLCIYLLN